MEHQDSILIVDDELALAETLCDVLVDSGYRVASAANGAEALAYLRSHEAPSLILLDLMMPVMDGYTFRQEQLADPALAAIPVIVVTAGGPASRIQGLRVACTLQKPVSLPRLLAVLEAALRPATISPA